MFDQFTTQARMVVVRAQDEARAMGHRFIGTEHLLLGLLDAPDGPGPATGGGARGAARPGAGGAAGGGAAADVLGEAGVRAESVRQRIRQLVSGGTGDSGDIDADALRSIGIDLDAVREQVERTFGPGALDPPVAVPVRKGFLRRRQQHGSPKGHIPFSDRAKTVLFLSGSEASRLGHAYVGTEHLLLGLLREGQGLGAKVLFDAGLDLEALRQRTIDRAA